MRGFNEVYVNEDLSTMLTRMTSVMMIWNKGPELLLIQAAKPHRNAQEIRNPVKLRGVELWQQVQLCLHRSL